MENGLLPSFDLDRMELLLALTRGLFVAALLSTFGALLFRCVLLGPCVRLMPEGKAQIVERRTLHLGRMSLVAAGVGLIAWLGLQAASIADAETARQTIAALPSVLLQTRFGQVLLAQAVALIAVAAISTAAGPRRLCLATCFAGVAVLLQAGHSHAFAMHHGPSVLLVSQSLHVLMAGAWLGGLAPLLVLIYAASPEIAGLAARRFSTTIGIPAVAVMAATALFQGIELSGGVTGLTGTAYGWVLLAKTGLFLLLLSLAALNRFYVLRALQGGGAKTASRLLIRSIAAETMLGLGVVLAAGLLSSLPPGMHEMALHQRDACAGFCNTVALEISR